MRGEARASRLMWIVLPLMAVVGAVAWWPLHRQNQALGQRIEQTKRELADARRTAERHERLSEQIERMRSRLRDDRQHIPQNPKLTELFASLTGAIEQLGLRDPDLSSGSIVNRPHVRAMPIRLTFRGSAVQAFNLLRRIEDMPRLIQPTSLVMEAPNQAAEESDGVRVDLRLQAFFHGTDRGGTDRGEESP